MTITATKTVKEIAIEFPYSTRVFEKLGIDYCCGGGKSLSDACTAAGVTWNELQNLLETAAPKNEPQINWQTKSLTELVHYILDKHHVYTKEALIRIKNLLAKVCSVHGQNHPELNELNKAFQSLSNELGPHMFKEEQILFPYMLELEQATQFPACPFGTVSNPIRMMMYEHDNAGELLRQMRQITGGYTAPADACVTYNTLYQAVLEFEQDLHEHIHLENNILFPRAEALESAARHETIL